VTGARAWALAAIGFTIGGAIGGWRLHRNPADGRHAPASSSFPADGDRDRPACAELPEVAARAVMVDTMGREAESLLAANLLAHFLPPKDLPARFSRGALEQALRTSIDAAGVQAEVLATDCSEYTPA
jgi:hypothetical protein